VKVAELETVFTADTRPFEAKAKAVRADREALDRAVEIRVDADGARALATMDRVASSARGLPDADIQVDADISSAERALDDVADSAESSGGKAGKMAGASLVGGIVGALAGNFFD
jgi:hypothetical protein